MKKQKQSESVETPFIKDPEKRTQAIQILSLLTRDEPEFLQDFNSIVVSNRESKHDLQLTELRKLGVRIEEITCFNDEGFWSILDCHY